MAFLTAFCIVLVLALAFVLIRRALPILSAAVTAWLVWSLTRDAASAGVASIAILLVVSWLLDVAAENAGTRRLIVGAEIAAGALVAGVVAFLIAGASTATSVWIVIGSAICAVMIVARWRQLAL